MWATILRRISGPPTFRVLGKTRGETEWRMIGVYATPRRNRGSSWPLLRGSCTCWAAEIISVGDDFADALLNDPRISNITPEAPVSVIGGRFINIAERMDQGASVFPTQAEIMAHEIGHTYQAIRLRPLYLPIVGALTLFREGPHWWNYFENDASEQGQFGGIVD